MGDYKIISKGEFFIKYMKLEWHNEKRKVKDLIPFEKNPRKIYPKQSEDLKKSLEKFNLVEIPAIDIDNKIIAGHQRLKILQLLNRGEEEIDVRVPNRKLTDEEFVEYNLRSNRNTGEWDWKLLGEFDENFLVDIGFDEVELEAHLLEDFDSEALAVDYPFGTINSWVRIGDYTCEIEDDKYQKVKKMIEENGGVSSFLENLIKDYEQRNTK